jgi:hypothetical protein
MSPLSRRFLYTAAVFLAVGVGLGLVLLVRRELLGRWPSPYLISGHAHLVLVGAVLETILGTALWMFPRPIRRELPESAGVAIAAWWLLTAGTTLRALAECLRAGSALGVLRPDEPLFIPDSRWC